MILGIGIDLVSAARIEHLMFQFKDKFLARVFTKEEIKKAKKIEVSKDDIMPRALFYAKRFAAKEAFAKALGLGIGRGIDFTDIEIENDEFGAPKITILNQKEDFIKKHFNCENFQIKLSLTDENPLASAIVIIEKLS